MAVTIVDTGLSFGSNHTARNGAPKGILLHHAAGNGSVEQIHRTHRQRGYAGIGYHFYVRKDGRVYRGRPEAWQGAHATGYNDRIGICAEGNFETETMSKAQQEAVAQTVRYCLDKYGALTVKGHRDVAPTACPGRHYPMNAILQAATASVPDDGKATRIRAFQKAAMADGIALAKYGADGQWGQETAAATRYVLRRGAHGERVRFVQQELTARGLSVGASGADGIFGADTERAVKAFQTERALVADGAVGEKTFRALLGV